MRWWLLSLALLGTAAWATATEEAAGDEVAQRRLEEEQLLQSLADLAEELNEAKQGRPEEAKRTLRFTGSRGRRSSARGPLTGAERLALSPLSRFVGSRGRRSGALPRFFGARGRRAGGGLRFFGARGRRGGLRFLGSRGKRAWRVPTGAESQLKRSNAFPGFHGSRG